MNDCPGMQWVVYVYQMGQPQPLFVYFRFPNTVLQKFVDFIWIRTRIVRVEGEHDHQYGLCGVWLKCIQRYLIWSSDIISTTFLFKRCQIYWGAAGSSVDSSAPSILPPRVWFPSTPSMHLSVIVKFLLHLSCIVNRTKISKKSSSSAHFLF